MGASNTDMVLARNKDGIWQRYRLLKQRNIQKKKVGFLEGPEALQEAYRQGLQEGYGEGLVDGVDLGLDVGASLTMTPAPTSVSPLDLC